ncbi:MAG: hypothetical protein ABIO70_11900 [Pseudomonadota bacterium]
MDRAEQLLNKLDLAEEADRETIWSAADVVLTAEDIQGAIQAERPCVDWMLLRFDAGRPGQPLPDPRVALDAVMSGTGGTREAYAAVFGGLELSHEAPIVAILVNCAVAALRERPGWLARWLAGRAGLACIALGDPQRAWAFIDGLVGEGRPEPHLSLLHRFTPLRGHPDLLASSWVRGAIVNLWSALKVPLVPSLPWPPSPAAEEPLRLVERIKEVGAPDVGIMIGALAQAIMEGGWQPVPEHDPLIDDLERRALAGEPPPVLSELPRWFRSWARTLGREGRHGLAYLAGHLLWRHGCDEKPLVGALIFPAARRLDLAILDECFDEPKLSVLFEDLRQACEGLPEDLTDALIATALPRHSRSSEALVTLCANLPALEHVTGRPGGAVEWAVRMVRQIEADRGAEQMAARPRWERLREQVSAAWKRLGDHTTLVGADVERAARSIELPEVDQALLELAQEEELLPGERLIQALALMRGLSSMPPATHWEATLRYDASQALWALQALSCFDLRLRLLDALIESPHPMHSVAGLHFQRANTLRVLHRGTHEADERILAGLIEAAALARHSSELSVLADALSALGKSVASLREEGRQISSESLFQTTLEEVQRALALPLPPYQRATVLQASAHLVRVIDDRRSCDALAEAAGLLDEGEPLRAELEAELVAGLARQGLPREAVARGRAALDHVRERASDTVIGMLHLSLGHALMLAGEPLVEARRHLEAGLERVRSVDPQNEAAARIHLLGLGNAQGDRALVDRQMEWLEARWETLPLVSKLDTARGGAIAAADREDHHAAYLWWQRVAPLVAGTSWQAEVDVERALASLRAGERADADRLLAALIEGCTEPLVWARIAEAACNHGALLTPATLERIAEVARSWEMPSVEARVLEHLGDHDGALARLQAALASGVDGDERLLCLHLLVTLNRHLPQEQLQQRCDELERQLEVGPLHAHIRIDLANALRLSAGTDSDRLERALRQAERSLPDLKTHREVEQGQRVVAHGLTDLVRARAGAIDLIARVRWLTQPSALPATEVGRLRVNAAFNLLLPGPISHADSLALAEELAALAERDLGADPELTALYLRCAWLRDLHERRGDPVPHPTGLGGGPADDFPTWLVCWVQGSDHRAAPREVEGALQDILLAIRLRPDAADRVLAQVVRCTPGMSKEGRRVSLEFAFHEVQGQQRGAGAWRALEASLEKLRRKQRDGYTRSLEAALRQSRGEPSAPSPSQARASRIKTEAQAYQAFQVAVEHMRDLNMDPQREDARQLIDEARALLHQATEFARKRRLPQYPDYLTSLGNAWKTEPGEDLDKALALYAQVRRCDLHPMQRAKLDKVEADALRKRGGDDDLRRAVPLLERSICDRTGWERAESLVALGGLLRQHPDFEDEERTQQSVGRFMEATRISPGHVEAQLPLLLRLLGTWRRKLPDDERPGRLLDELRAIYPHRAAEIARPIAFPSEGLVVHITQMMQHPSSKLYLGFWNRLASEGEISRDPMGISERFGPSAAAKLRETRRQGRLLGDAAGMEAALEEMGRYAEGDPAFPGATLVRTRLLAELCRLGHGQPPEVRAASDKAWSALRTIDDPLVRATLLQQLACVWSPHDHAGDPVRDFGMAAEIAREAYLLDAEHGGGSEDIVETLARSLRYSPAGDLDANLREARSLYMRLAEKARADGAPELLANTLQCLADVDSQLAEGDPVARLRRGERWIAEALELTRLPHKRPEFMTSLAWQRTQIAMHLPAEEAIATLRDALATFDRTDLEALDPHIRGHHLHNRAVAESMLARLTDGRQADVAIWRRRLEELQDGEQPSAVALIQHNLANALLVGSDVTLEELFEGLDLCERAAKVRTIEVNTRHHWETTLLAGTTWARALHPASEVPDESLPRPRHACWQEARRWLRRAVEAARVLGVGDELHRAGLALADLVVSARTTRDAIEVAEEAWVAVSDTVGALLLSGEARAEEAGKAHEVALVLAYRLAREGVLARGSGLAFAMDGDRAEIVLRWLLRGESSSRRSIGARLRRPGAVPMSAWMDWQDALTSRDPLRLGEALSSVRLHASAFLSGEQDLATTWRWLEARPGSVAIRVVLAFPLSVAVVLGVSGDGARRVRVLGLPAPPCPVEETQLAQVLGNAVGRGEEAWKAHDAAARWAREHIARPIERFLVEPPTCVLWCPSQVLRLLAPASLWPGIPVASSLSLVLSDLSAAPARKRSSLVVLADPGKDSKDGLGSAGQEAQASIVRAVAARGAVAQLASVGERHGPGVLADPRGALPGPASPDELLEHARDHDLVVVIAHGEAETPERAAIRCISATGAVEKLDVTALGRAPGRFAGAKVILLSCATGLVGSALHEPAGIAGVLLSAGARLVAAPMWPVRLDLASEVAVAIIAGMEQGVEPWERLARGGHSGAAQGPEMGPSAALSVQRREQRQEQFFARLQEIAFVTWVG